MVRSPPKTSRRARGTRRLGRRGLCRGPKGDPPITRWRRRLDRRAVRRRHRSLDHGTDLTGAKQPRRRIVPSTPLRMFDGGNDRGPPQCTTSLNQALSRVATRPRMCGGVSEPCSSLASFSLPVLGWVGGHRRSAIPVHCSGAVCVRGIASGSTGYGARVPSGVGVSPGDPRCIRSASGDPAAMSIWPAGPVRLP